MWLQKLIQLIALSSTQNTNKILHQYLSLVTRTRCFSMIRIDLSEPCKIPGLAQKCTFSGCRVPQVSGNSKLTPVCRFGEDVDSKCEYYDQPNDNAQTVDLVKSLQIHSRASNNAGEIWKLIYSLIKDKDLYRLVSGIHYSIFLHICMYYKYVGVGFYGNPWLYQSKKSMEYEKNLIFCLAFMKNVFSKLTINNFRCSVEMQQTDQNLIQKIITLSCQKNFVSINRQTDLEAFTKILDAINCLECERCKLWGKIQFTGLEASLKLNNTDFKYALKGSELVFLVNLYYKLSSSIEFIKILEKYQYPFLETLKSYGIEIASLATTLILFFYLNTWFKRRDQRRNINKCKVD